MEGGRTTLRETEEAALHRLLFSLDRGPHDHLNIRIWLSGSKAQYKGGIPEIMVCRILMFMWSSWAILKCLPSGSMFAFRNVVGHRQSEGVGRVWRSRPGFNLGSK